MKLTKALVDGRDGFSLNGLVFAMPKSPKRQIAWMKMMEKKGYVFA